MKVSLKVNCELGLKLGPTAGRVGIELEAQCLRTAVGLGLSKEGFSQDPD